MGAPLRVKHASDKSKGGGKGKDKEDELTVVVKGASLSFAMALTWFSRIPAGTCPENLPFPRFPVRDQRRNATECIWKTFPFIFVSCNPTLPLHPKFDTQNPEPGGYMRVETFELFSLNPQTLVRKAHAPPTSPTETLTVTAYPKPQTRAKS